MLSRPILAAAAIVAAFATTSLAVSPAVAQPAASVTISYQDLNLRSAEGRSALDARIELAARQVCGEPSFELRLAAMSRACRDEAVASASAQADVAAGRRGTVRVSQAAN